jgi:hypothetical protein
MGGDLRGRPGRVWLEGEDEEKDALCISVGGGEDLADMVGLSRYCS